MQPNAVAISLALTSALAVTSAASTATLPGADVIIPEGATWKYLDDGSDQGTAWRDPSFDDTSWASGPAELGYGDGDEATVVDFGPDANNKYITTYFRKTVTVTNPGQYTSLSFRLLRDDGAVVYVNGVEAFRDNMPGGTITYTTFAASTISGSAESTWLTHFLSPTLFQDGQNTIAVEVHQRVVDSSDISLNVELIATDTVFLVRPPYLQLGTDTTMHIVWKTDIETDGRLAYGTSPGSLNSFVDDPVLKKKHDVELTGLVPDTTYYYSVGTTTDVLAGDDADHFFVTNPVPGPAKPFRLWILGDSGTADANAASVRDAFYNFAGTTRPDLWLMLGDNAYNSGTIAEYDAAVFNMYPETLRQSVLWPTRGNHDTTANIYQATFTLPTAGEAGGVPSGTELYYSFDYANVHFICLDSYTSSSAVGGPMWTWCQSDIAATDQEWIVAFWHHPPYSKGSHNSDTESTLIGMRQNILPMLESNGVDLVFCGHSHSYERSYLIDGHYGNSGSFSAMHQVDDGDGREDGDGAYHKLAEPNAGAVYTTAGNSGKISGGSLNHNAMFHSVNVLGSIVLDFDGGRVDATFLTATGQVNDYYTLLHDDYDGTYCVANPHSQGCVALISSTGTPSATDVNAFTISASDTVQNNFGILFYGDTPDSFPFLNGERCVAAPIVRTPAQSSGGAFPCGGSLSFDFNAQIQGGQDQTLVPGATVYTQYWFRDPGSAFGSALTNALQFTIQP